MWTRKITIGILGISRKFVAPMTISPIALASIIRLMKTLSLRQNRWILGRKESSTRWSAWGYAGRFRAQIAHLKHVTTRWEVFAPASSSITSRLVAIKATKSKGMVCFTLDASNAFFHAACEEKCCVYPPSEWPDAWVEAGGNPDTVCELVREVYGRRVVSCQWTKWFVQQLCNIGLQQSLEAP